MRRRVIMAPAGKSLCLRASELGSGEFPLRTGAAETVPDNSSMLATITDNI